MFWLASLCVVLLAGLWVLWPLLRGDSRFKVTGLLVLLSFLPLVYWQYQIVGSPRALQEIEPTISVNTDASLEELVVTLREKLTESPADLEGWVLLGRTYKTMEDYPAAVEALGTANRLVPDVPLIWVELVEAQLFASGNPDMTPEMVQRLQQAVAQQPDLQKGWWLLGLAAAQRGEDEQAISYWRKLMQGLEPDSPVAQSVEAQIAEAEGRLQGAGTASSPDTNQQWQGPELEIDLNAEAREELASLPEASALFVIARAPGETFGPPLAVKRINQPVFPLQLTLSDADSMMSQRPVSGFSSLQLQARLSLSGEAMAASGDWQSEVINWSSGQTEAAKLTLDTRLE